MEDYLFLAPTGAQERLICVRSFVRSSVRPSELSLSIAHNLHLFASDDIRMTSG